MFSSKFQSRLPFRNPLNSFYSVRFLSETLLIASISPDFLQNPA